MHFVSQPKNTKAICFYFQKSRKKAVEEWKIGNIRPIQ